MARKRPAGTGSIHFEEGRRRWVARLSYVDPLTGQRRRKAVYATSQKAVLAKLDEVRRRLADDKPASDSALTLGAWVDRWRETSLKASSRSDSTIENYGHMTKHITGSTIAGLPLRRLTASHVEGLIAELRERGLAQSTVRSAFGVLRLALDTAVRDGLVARNVAALVRRPGVDRNEARHLSADELIALLRECESSRHYPVLRLLAVTGLRIGEALALHWGDVDVDGGLLHVRGTLGRVNGQLRITTPKTERSRRSVPITAETAEWLRQHRITQDAERARAANQWEPHALVFCTALGRPIDPRNTLRVVEKAAAGLELDGVGNHSIRHTTATKMLEAGVHVEAVARLLGHADASVTLSTYAHSSPDVERSAVEGLSAQLGL